MAHISEERIAQQAARIRRQVLTAQGYSPADLLLKRCRVVNLYTNKIHEADIAIVDGKIAAVRENYQGTAIQTMDCRGLYATPGLLAAPVDPALSPATLSELAPTIVPQGVTGACVTASRYDAADPRAHRVHLDPAPDLPRRVVVEASGWTSLHPESQATCSSFAEVLACIRRGTTVFLAGTLDADTATAIFEGVMQHGLDTRHLCLGVDASLNTFAPAGPGSPAHLVTLAQRAGMSPFQAFQMASQNIALHFGLEHLLGSVAPGRYADLLLLYGPTRFPPACVMVGGQPVAADGKPLWSVEPEARVSDGRVTPTREMGEPHPA